jgi:EAL domain-containing protein (putative c-di-GMP-specific phosphodiesterase class I)
VVAEGLQDRMAETILVEAGCDAAQGFLVGRPVEAAEITALLRQHAGPAEPHADEAAL